MKKSIFLFFLIVCLNGYSQITLDFQNSANLINVKLNNLETKYANNDPEVISTQNQFSLYNSDGTLYKTIRLPPKPDSSAHILNVSWITTSLFDNDSSDIEYLVVYYWDSTYAYSYKDVRIIREDQTILLDEMNASSYYYIPQIYNTAQGPKLILYSMYANNTIYQTKVYSLPGKLSSAIKNEINPTENNFCVFPNPNNGSFFIKIHSNEGNKNLIDLYSINGKLINTYISNTNLLEIHETALSEGLYLLVNPSYNSKLFSKMIIKK